MPDQQQQPPDGDWFEDLTGGEAAEPEQDTPTDFLRRIMANPNEPATARVAAAKVLMDRGVGAQDDDATLALARNMREITDARLDAEVARFMQQGVTAPDEGVEAYFSKLVEHTEPMQGDRPLPARWEREVRRRVARRVRRIVADFDRRVQAATQILPQQDAAAPSAAQQQQVAVVVPLHLRRRSERTVAEQVEQEMIDSRRAELPPGARQHVPVGLDPQALGRAWPSGRA
jgi:hypothetical protein